MHRFYLPAEQVGSSVASIEDPQTISHIKKTLRLKPGEEVELFDGEGLIHSGVLQLVTGSKVTVELTAERFEEHPQKPRVIVAQAATQAGKVADVLRGCTEVGVDGFILFESEYSQGKLKKGKEERLQRIIVEAVRQSERSWLPTLAVAESFEQVFAGDYTHKLLLAARADNQTLDIADLKPQLTADDTVLVAIGPEGGFSAQEQSKALELGIDIAHLDLPVLRTQTAGVVVSSILLY